MTTTWWLSCHVDYACRHSGVCCTAGWPLPVEEAVVPAIDAAVADGRLTTVDGRRAWLVERIEAPAGTAGTLRQVRDACVFHRTRTRALPGGGPNECAVHATLGTPALPATCLHFPRVCLVDDRGVRVALSHVCPTAADLLLRDAAPLAIVAGPPALPVGVPEGLDARGELPPRLSAGVLMDLDALTAWEARVVDQLAGPSALAGSAEAVLVGLRCQADELTRWTPRQGPLVDAIRALAWPAVRREAADPDDLDRAEAALSTVAATCRPPWTWPAVPADLAALDARWVAPTWPALAPAVRRYLAARAFGAWASYQTEAAGGLVAWLDIVLGVLRVECGRAAAAAGQVLDRAVLRQAIGQADLLLLHYADLADLADAWP